MLKDKPTDKQLQKIARNTADKHELSNVYTDLYSSVEISDVLTTSEYIEQHPPLIREDD